MTLESGPVNGRRLPCVKRDRPGGFVLFCAVVLLAMAGCSDGGRGVDPDVPDSLVVKSEAFGSGGRIPGVYTCEGADRSPPLAVDNVPDEARSLVIVLDDPDAPGGSFDHWVVWNLPPDLGRLPSGLPTTPAPDTPPGTRQGLNDFHHYGYGGPCPPPGTSHRYQFRVFALDESLELPRTTRKQALMKAMEGAVLARGRLQGVFDR